jgi:aspartyl-tRNA(Asn)/glutamyl-tRNA(Gln) amidotransferase subunit B
MPELPRVMAARFVADYGLPEYDATTLTQSKAMGAYFETAAGESGQPKLASNWVMGELSRRVNLGETTFDDPAVPASFLAAMIRRIADGTVSSTMGKKLFEALWVLDLYDGDEPLDAQATVDDIIERNGFKQMNDAGALEKIVDEVIAANPANVEQIRAGKDKAFNALVGQAMKASKGKANPQQVGELLRRKLGL